MLSLAFTFPAGRYHATPWDRHVNEGSVAWPPEPWRVLRGLIATWHHKVKHDERHTETTLQRLIESLASRLPQYVLPSAVFSHTRHYMPQWSVGDTSLIFDAFAVVGRDKPFYMTWADLELADDETALLDDLLAVMGYLGRAESWVDAARVNVNATPNCSPGEESYDPETGEILGEVVTLLAPLSPDSYRTLRQGFLSDKKVANKLLPALPETLVDALSIDTTTLRKQGWSQPPAAWKVNYLRPVDALRSKLAPPRKSSQGFDSVQYMLSDKPLSQREVVGRVRRLLPRVEDTLRIGELLRQAIMSQAARACGEDAIPATISGHGLPADNSHRHAFYLPWDANGDGRIDRLLVHVPGGVPSAIRGAVERLDRLWDAGGAWRVALEGIGDTSVGDPLTRRSHIWTSVTPYLHPWYVKKRFAIEDQLRRECRGRGLPEIASLERLASVRIGTIDRRSIDFHRTRSKRGLRQPDRQGSFWRLTFVGEVPGPLSLGFGCHLGLGLFRPA